MPSEDIGTSNMQLSQSADMLRAEYAAPSKDPHEAAVPAPVFALAHARVPDREALV